MGYSQRAGAGGTSMSNESSKEVVRNSYFLNASSKFLQNVPVGRRSAFSLLHKLAGKPERFIQQLDGGMKFPVDCKDKEIALKVALNKTYEPVVGALFLSKCNNNDIVWDVGANKGYYTLLAQEKIGGRGRVYAYEPVPENVIDLDLIVSLNNLNNFIVEPVALSSAVGESSFSLEGWSMGVSAWGKLLNGNAESVKEKITVQTSTIDHEVERLKLEKIDMIKMDIQGGELGAIRGAKTALENGVIKNILLELHDMMLTSDECHEIVETLLDAGLSGKAFAQDEIPDNVAVNTIRKNIPLDLSNYGVPAQDYNWNKRRNVNARGLPTDDYAKPLQFLLSLD